MEAPDVVEEAEEAEGSEGEPASSRPEQEGGSLCPVTVMGGKRAVLRNKHLSFLFKKKKKNFTKGEANNVHILIIQINSTLSGTLA